MLFKALLLFRMMFSVSTIADNTLYSTIANLSYTFLFLCLQRHCKECRRQLFGVETSSSVNEGWVLLGKEKNHIDLIIISLVLLLQDAWDLGAWYKS